jgi:hypothetical protein
LRLVGLWLAGLASIALSLAIGLVCADWHIVWRIVIAVLACAAALTVAVRAARQDELGIRAGIGLGILCFVVVMAQPTDLMRTHVGQSVTIRVAAAPEHASAVAFHFEDGELVPRYLGEALTYASTKQSTSKYLTCAAPIVPAGWTAAEPIPAWGILTFEGITICQSVYFAESVEAWKQGRREAVAVDASERDDATKAVDEVTKKRGLVPAPRAPILKLVPQGLATLAAEAEHDAARWLEWCLGLWTIALPMAAAIRRARAG